MGQKLFSEISKELKGTRDMTNGSDKRDNLWAKFETATFQHAYNSKLFSTILYYFGKKIHNSRKLLHKTTYIEVFYVGNIQGFQNGLLLF